MKLSKNMLAGKVTVPACALAVLALSPHGPGPRLDTDQDRGDHRAGRCRRCVGPDGSHHPGIIVKHT